MMLRKSSMERAVMVWEVIRPVEHIFNMVVAAIFPLGIFIIGGIVYLPSVIMTFFQLSLSK